MKISEIQSPVYIVGLGKSGLAAYDFLVLSGVEKDQIFLFDEKDPRAQIKTWDELTTLTSLQKGTFVVSPGVPLKTDFFKSKKLAGWEITSEIDLATTVLDHEMIVGITGSVGKSTVTSLLGVAAVVEDSNAFVGGNLGTPFCQYAIEKLKGRLPAKYVVLELSSYQLENCHQLKLNFSAITYLSANHLERYSSLEEYYLTKCGIGKITENACVINSKSKDLVQFKKYIHASVIETKIRPTRISLIGEHNLQNYFVALELARLLKFSEKSIQAMREFPGLEHRLEKVGTFNDVTYINDSKATAMDSVLVATQGTLEGLQAGATLFLLLGGKDKNLPWEQLKVLNIQSKIQFVFFGQCASVAQQKSNLHGPLFINLKQACEYVFQNVKNFDYVLLSPGGTSLDEFKNFEDRGKQFKKYISDYYSEK